MQEAEDRLSFFPSVNCDSRLGNPLLLPGPVPGNPVAMRQFTTIAQWDAYLKTLRLSGTPPGLLQRDYEHMLRVLALAWWEAPVIKLAELAALARLETAITLRYPGKKFRGLESAMQHLIQSNNVSNSDLRTYRESGGAIVENLLLDRKSPRGTSLSEIRNRLAHGDPFETMPWAGLFEVVRDLIDFMYPPSTAAVS